MIDGRTDDRSGGIFPSVGPGTELSGPISGDTLSVAG